MEIRSLLPHELDAWATHCAMVFYSDSREYFLNHFNNDPWRDTDGIFVAMDEDTIAATVRVFRREVWLFGKKISMGGIGEVSTKEAYRCKGLSGKLLQRAIAWMEQQGIQVSVLYSGLHEHYGRYGWQVIPVLERRFQGISAQPCAIQPMTREDIPAMMALEAKSVKQIWSIVRESRDYWDNWFWQEAASGKGLLAVQDGELKAWLLYSLREDSWHVREFSSLPGFESLFDGLCAAAAISEGRANQPFDAPGWIPTATPESERYENTYSMVRLITPFWADGSDIDSTEKLILLTGDCRDSEIDHF